LRHRALLAQRAAPLAAVVALHAAAVAALLQAPGVRERMVHAVPLFVRFVSEPPSRPPHPRLALQLALREPLQATIPLPQVVIEQSRPTVTVAAREIPSVAVPGSASPEHVAPPAIDAPRFDLAYLRNPAPAYPPLSRRLHEQGRVLLWVRVSAQGEAREVRVQASSGSARLDQAATEAVRRWRFSPARQGGEKIEGVALVPIAFTLDA